MKKELVIVTVTYSFDSEVAAIVFDNYEQARAYIKEDFENEKRIDVEENGYLIDEGKRIVYDDNNNVIDLTTKEFDLLMLFVKNRGTAFLREQILEKVWDDNYFGSDRVVDDTLRRLRKKMPNPILKSE